MLGAGRSRGDVEVNTGRTRRRAARATAVLVAMVVALVAAACSSGSGSGGSAPTTSPGGGPAVEGTDARLGSRHVGRQPDGSIVVASGQVLRPAGRQVEFRGRPVAVAVRPDGKTAAFLSGTSLQGGSAPLLTVVDLASGKVLQQVSPSNGSAASFDGLAYSPDGSHLYASAINSVIDSTVAPDGRLTVSRVLLDGEYPTGLAVSSDGRTLYAALNAKNALAVVDLASGNETARLPVGNAPRDVALANGKVYVANEGGRPAQAGDVTNLSAGTPIVADRERGAASTGTVSIVDPATRQVTSVPVELHPTALAVHGSYVLVSNTNSDSVSVIDAAQAEAVSTFSVAPHPSIGAGSAPNALAFLPDGRLLVSLGRDDALGVYSWTAPTRPARLEGLIPTGWYPAGVAVDGAGKRIVIANAEGVGTLGPDSVSLEDTLYPKANARHPKSHTILAWLGSGSIVPFPGDRALADGAATVARNNGWDGVDAAAARSDAAPQPVPARIGEPSPIKKVVYVIKENRTYDQVLGDVSRGNGDPSFVQFGPSITPNHHALATKFTLFDNFYSAGAVSADGHQWVTQADDPDYVEREYNAYPGGRSYPSNGQDALAYLSTGFLWEDAQRHGKSVAVFGEYADLGKSPTTSDIPSLDRALVRDYPPFDLKIPDQRRADIFLSKLKEWERTGDMPDLVIVHLPNDHTSGTDPGAPTPQAQVADNDLALGRIVEGLSKSRFWKESALFAVEDDPQFGADHVDGHRTIALAAGPYVARGKTDSTFYSQVNLVRTIEQILGLPPMNRMDVAATPMRSAFVGTADDAPYRALPPPYLQTSAPPTNAQAASLHGIRRAWALASARMDFSTPDVEANRERLNRVVWYATTGWDRPYPGDTRVLRPDEVPST
jgi:YVTN family beta-propeller protein